VKAVIPDSTSESFDIQESSDTPKVKMFFCFIFIIKQDIRIYVSYSRPNGWTEWADIF